MTRDHNKSYVADSLRRVPARDGPAGVLDHVGIFDEGHRIDCGVSIQATIMDGGRYPVIAVPWRVVYNHPSERIPWRG